MNLLSELEGKKQEVLVSSMLRYLLSGSHELRSAFFDLLSRLLGPIGTGNHFATYLEFPTTSKELHNGRLDLLLETDEALIGIEIKIWAGLQTNQPEKYVACLADRAIDLAKLRGVDHYPCFLIVLGPASRKKSIERELKSRAKNGAFKQLADNCKFLAWEDVFDRFDETRSPAPQMRFLANQIRSYFADIEGQLGNFAAIAPHLHRWEPHGSRWHRDLLGGIWRLLPGSGNRLGAAPAWCGYYIQSDNHKVRGWYGFVPKDQLTNTADPRDAELILQLNSVVPSWDTEAYILPAKYKSEGSEDNVWIIRYQEDWRMAEWDRIFKGVRIIIDQNTG